MPLQTVENRRLYRQIADQIAALIRVGEFPAGARLPPERALAAQLGVSRPSVREALIALEVEGFVEVRVGSGVYVRRAPPVAHTGPLPAETGPFELIRARWIIEGECAALAAKEATPEQTASMKRALDAMEFDRRKGDPLVHDRLFHLRVAEGTGNSALLLAVETLWRQRMGPLFLQLEHHFDSPDLWRVAIAEHRAVLTAIERHDAHGARAAMRRHMNQAARRFSASWRAKKPD